MKRPSSEGAGIWIRGVVFAARPVWSHIHDNLFSSLNISCSPSSANVLSGPLDSHVPAACLCISTAARNLVTRTGLDVDSRPRLQQYAERSAERHDSTSAIQHAKRLT